MGLTRIAVSCLPFFALGMSPWRGIAQRNKCPFPSLPVQCNLGHLRLVNDFRLKIIKSLSLSLSFPVFLFLSVFLSQFFHKNRKNRWGEVNWLLFQSENGNRTEGGSWKKERTLMILNRCRPRWTDNKLTEELTSAVIIVNHHYSCITVNQKLTSFLENNCSFVVLHT